MNVVNWSLLDFFPDPILISILDVGAALLDQPPYQGLIDAKRCRVVGFEPNSVECQRLNQIYGAPHRFFPYFIGDGKPGTFYETSWAPTCSLFEPNTPLLQCFPSIEAVVRPVAQHAVETVRLDDFDSITDIDYIKIDIQGGELAVFQNATRLLQSVTIIQTEVNFVELYKNQPLFSDVDQFLRSQGFQLHRFDSIHSRAFGPIVVNNNRNQGLGQVLWTDAIYVKDWLRFDALTPDKLKKLAILLHDISRSCDLVHLVLQAYDRKVGSAIAADYLARLVAPPTTT
jgi:FkbM family methyltransferase